jgi:hypothetical protein
MTLALYALVAGLAFLHVFITFPGLSSAAGMDQAQIAREVARGHGYSTKLIRPHALRQLVDSGRAPATLTTLPDTFHPPLQPLFWAAIFKPLQQWWPFETGRTIFLLDRVIAALGVIWLLVTLMLAHDMARRLFDENVGTLTLCSLVASAAMWRLAVSGSPVLPLLCFTTLVLHTLTLISTRTLQHAAVGFGLGAILITGALAMVASHWMAWPILIGIIAGTAFFLRGLAAALGAVLCAVVLGWCYRSYGLTGDPLGAIKATLLSFVGSESDYGIIRDYDRSAQVVYLDAVVRKLSANSLDQLNNLHLYLGGVVPALLFRRAEVRAMRSIIACTWGTAAAAMCLMGLPEKDQDDNQIHMVLVPALSMYGMAAMAVLWARLQPGRAGIWTTKGYAIILLTLTAWPMAMTLPSNLRMGLFRKNEHMNWPPYAPPRIAKLTGYTTPAEVIVADAPWSIAWYADRTTLYLPKNLAQYEQLNTVIRNAGMTTAGFVFSPWSTKDATVSTQLGGPFRDWNEPIFRGPVMGVEVDLAKEWRSKFPFPVPYLLAGLPSNSGRVAPAMVFYSDGSKRRDVQAATAADAAARSLEVK